VATFSVRNALLKLTDVFLPIGPGIGALPVEVALLKPTYIFISLGPGIGALPVPFVILVFTDVFLPLSHLVLLSLMNGRVLLSNLIEKLLVMHGRVVFVFG